EHDRAGFLARGVEPLLRARPHDGLLDDAAVVADGVHGDSTGAASTVEMLAEALIGVLSLVVAVRADEAVENLPDGQRQVVRVLAEHGFDARNQGERLLLRRPRCKPAHSRALALGS